MRSSLIILSMLILSGCASQYELSNDRCRDKESGQFVKTELCK